MSWYFTEMAKHSIVQTMLHNSSWSLVFWCQRSWWNSIGFTPNVGAKHKWGRFKLTIFDEETVHDRGIVTADG